MVWEEVCPVVQFTVTNHGASTQDGHIQNITISID